MASSEDHSLSERGTESGSFLYESFAANIKSIETFRSKRTLEEKTLLLTKLVNHRANNTGQSVPTSTSWNLESENTNNLKYNLESKTENQWNCAVYKTSKSTGDLTLSGMEQNCPMSANDSCSNRGDIYSQHFRNSGSYNDPENDQQTEQISQTANIHECHPLALRASSEDLPGLRCPSGSTENQSSADSSPNDTVSSEIDLSADVEQAMYSDFLQKMYATLSNEHVDIHPISFDMTHPGDVYDYSRIPRRSKLDYNHAKAALSAVARLHGYSFIFFMHFPDFGISQKAVLNRANSFMNRLLKTSVIADSEPLYSHLRSAIELMAGPIYPFFLKVSEDFKPLFKVMCHGDLEVSNILFHYNVDGEIDDVRLVNFRYPAICAPEVDIMQLFASSIQEDMHNYFWKDLLQHYRQVLECTVKNFGPLPVPSVKEFCKRMEGNRIFEFIFTCTSEVPDLGRINRVHKALHEQGYYSYQNEQ